MRVGSQSTPRPRIHSRTLPRGPGRGWPGGYVNGFPSPTHSEGDSVGFTAGSGSTRMSAGLPDRT